MSDICEIGQREIRFQISKLREGNRKMKKQIFTLIELLIVIAIIAI